MVYTSTKKTEKPFLHRNYHESMRKDVTLTSLFPANPALWEARFAVCYHLPGSIRTWEHESSFGNNDQAGGRRWNVR